MNTMIPAFEDERVQEVLQGLANNKTRDELASSFGHKNYKTLDIYMRRKGFKWDRTAGTYVLDQPETTPEVASIDRTKAGKVIMMLKDKDADVRQIAMQLGFKNHQELADHMKVRRYFWNSKLNNYEKMSGIPEEATLPDKDKLEDSSGMIKLPDRPPKDLTDFQTYLPILEIIEQNKDKLMELLQSTEDTNSFPKYGLPGVPTTKTIQMITSLQEVVKEFCAEKNLTQRELFEIALIDFFRKYGHGHIINPILRKK
ncbi:hypothetical protein KP77_28580 [Jeotgalibacillus alimentarius]|uniref:Uncharacterized protein n=1 Tax=Jeotgalibacillus alimentarius TaxID=135826 RepID=A0A0C2VMA5_9BACL|nr:hypothetical protein [Jeotgalibacillus alimentarius]KIL45566.1 hypothetical protein KP77_28580 [Jeotgalibacillus alimentarius]